MALSITPISDVFSTAPQITAADIAEIAALGFKTVINNRPDHEGGADQPTSDAIKAAAEAAGLDYFHIPVIPNQIQSAQIEQFAATFSDAQKPVLGFCRTGRRAGSIMELALKTA